MSELKKSERILRGAYITVSILAGVLFAILFSLTPASTDDLLFMLPSKGMDRGFGLWKEMVEFFPYILSSQSGRLGNILAMPFLYLFPRWVFGVLSGGVIVLLLIFSCRLTGVRPGSVVSWLIVATVVFAYPWYDYLFLVTYGINYLWAGTLCVIAMWGFMNIRQFGPLGFIGTLILLFVAGWMHEGFGAPLTGGLVLWLLLNWKKRDGREVLGVLAAGIGTCMTAMFPAFWVRAEEETDFIFKFTFKEALMQLGPALLFAVVFLISLLWVVSQRRYRKLLSIRSALPAITGFVLVSTAVFLKYYNGPRTGAPLLLFSALGCAMTFSLSGGRRSRPIVAAVSGLLVSVAMLVNLSYACALQKKLQKEYDDIVRLFESSPDGTFYYDVSYPVADPSLFKTSVRVFHEKTPKLFWKVYYGGSEKDLVILPSAMRGFSPEKSSPSAHTPGAMIYNGWIVLPDTTGVDSFKRIHVLSEGGTDIATRFRRDYFKAADGKEYILITPHVKVLDPSLTIEDVILYDHSR